MKPSTNNQDSQDAYQNILNQAEEPQHMCQLFKTTPWPVHQDHSLRVGPQKNPGHVIHPYGRQTGLKIPKAILRLLAFDVSSVLQISAKIEFGKN